MEWGEVENGMGRRSGKWNGEEEWKMEWGGGVENGMGRRSGKWSEWGGGVENKMGRSGKWNGEE